MSAAESVEKSRRLMRLFGENWAHIRHMEYYRMWCVNIYAVVVVGLFAAFGAAHLEAHLGYAAAFLFVFTVLNLLVTLKIEAVIENFAKANEKIRDHVLQVPDINESVAPIRTRTGVWKFIKFESVFTAFYSLVLAGIVVVVALRLKAMLGL